VIEINKEIYNIKEIANYLNLSVSGIRKLVREGKIPYFRVGNRIRFDIRKIDVWLEELEKKENRIILN